MIFFVKAILLFGLALFAAIGLILLRLIKADTEAVEIEVHEIEGAE